MSIDTLLGLREGMHTQEGVESVVVSDIDDKLASIALRNDFFPVRSFATRQYFSPKVYLIGMQTDETTGRKHTKERIRNIISETATPGSIILGEGAEASHLEPDPFSSLRNFIIYPFVGQFDVRFIDSKQIIDQIRSMSEIGIYTVDMDEIDKKRREEFFIPGILRAASDIKSGHVYVVLHYHHFINRHDILRRLELEKIPYLLICPQKAFPTPQDEETEEGMQRIYERDIIKTAKARF